MGIHFLFTQTVTGSVVIGNSHKYQTVKDADALGFSLHEGIKEAIMAEVKTHYDARAMAATTQMVWDILAA